MFSRARHLNFQTTPPTVPTRPVDRHQWRRTQQPTVSSLFYGPRGCPRCKTKRLSITCSPRTIKIRRRWRNFLQVRKPTEKRGFGMLSHGTNIPGPIATHSFSEYDRKVDFYVVDRTDFLHDVENSPLSWSKFGKSACWAQNAVFEVEHAKAPFHHRLLPTKSIGMAHC